MPTRAKCSEHSSIAKAEIAIVTDDDVVQYANAHHVADFLEPARDLDVFLARRGIATRMVMDEDHGGSGLADHGIIDLAGMDQRGGEGTFGNFYLPQLFVFIVQ